MIAAWMTYFLGLGLLVVVFVCGYRIGRLAEQDAQTARRLVPGSRMMRHDGPWRTCRVCGAAPGEPCTPQGIRRVPTQRPPS